MLLIGACVRSDAGPPMLGLQAVVHKTVSALMEHLVAGDWDTSLLENGEGTLASSTHPPTYSLTHSLTH